MLASFEEKMKDVQTMDISQYVGARGVLPGKSAADSVTVNQRQERAPVASGSADATVDTDQAEGCAYNDISHSTQFWLRSLCRVVAVEQSVNQSTLCLRKKRTPVVF